MNAFDHQEGRECEACRAITARVLWDCAEVVAAGAALLMLARAMELLW